MTFQKRKKICESFCESLHLPANVLRLLQSGIVSSDRLSYLNISTLDMMENISENDIISTFSHLVALKKY